MLLTESFIFVANKNHDYYQTHRFHVRHQFGIHADGLHKRKHVGYLQETRSLCQPKSKKGRDGTPHCAGDFRQSPCRAV